MSIMHGSSVIIKTLSAIAIIVSTGFSAKAFDPLMDPYNDAHVTISNSNATVGEIFTLVEKQTSFSFIYDENDINIYKEIIIEKGQQLLQVVLNNISKQAGLHFTEKLNMILVNQESVDFKNVAFKITSTPVTGVVTDSSGLPLEGITVAVKGSTMAVVTDAQGKFTISVPDNGVLIFSSVNYKTQEVAINGQTSLTIKLTINTKELNEVVVVGYQTIRRSDISGAISTVNVEDVSKIPVGFADQALQGQVSGVRITQSTGQPGDGIALRIRGVGSVNNNDPLYIIDGVPTQDGINFLAADDIASITVLKDAASAAIYGARSSNGVVVITTKGGKIGKAQISYSGYAGVQTHGKLTKMVNAQEYKTLFNEAAANDNAITVNPILMRKLIPDSIPMANTDWIGSIFQTAPMQDHELSVSGGTE